VEKTEKEVVRRFYELVNAGATERFDEICSPDLKGHAGAGSDLAELKNAVASPRSCGTWSKRANWSASGSPTPRPTKPTSQESRRAGAGSSSRPGT
jgi:ketosteroid isomerase-like protein